MSPENNSTTNFGDIAMCLSGGGYRAASFHLGSLKMLSELGFIDNVKMLSTVSGGTILGASYTMWRIEQEGKKKKESFDVFYDKFYSFLKDTDVVTKALNKLTEKRSKTTKGKLSLICEAANVYDEDLPFGQVKFGDYFEQEVVKSPFKEIIFNSTEFVRGNSFRFRASQKSRSVIGNNDFKVDKDVAKEIRIADIIAASSCFPSAFEPIIFPEDFKGMKGKLDKPFPISLMDGGIYDNQGIASLLLADKIVKKKKEDKSGILEESDKAILAENADFKEEEIETPDIDFFLISDTNQRNDEFLKPHITFNFAKSFQDNIIGWIANKADVPFAKVFGNLWNTYYWISLIIGLILLFYSIFLVQQIISFFSQNLFTLSNFFWVFAVYFIPLLLAIGFYTLLVTIYKYKTKLVKWLEERRVIEVKDLKFDILNFLEKITLNDLANLLITRFNSLVTMSSSVFMKRIRSLQITLVKANPFRTKRVAFNYIYDMNATDKRIKLWKMDPDLEPSEDMRLLSKAAEEIETTLWFTNEKPLEALVLCGRMTVCLSLLKFLIEDKGVLPDDKTNPYHNDYQKIKAEWMKFKKDYKH